MAAARRNAFIAAATGSPRALPTFIEANVSRLLDYALLIYPKADTLADILPSVAHKQLQEVWQALYTQISKTNHRACYILFDCMQARLSRRCLLAARRYRTIAMSLPSRPLRTSRPSCASSQPMCASPIPLHQSTFRPRQRPSMVWAWPTLSIGV